MDKQLKECLENKENDYIFPFLWLHGESHEQLKKQILAIKQSGCNSFCAESRPFPRFCEEQWWEDFGFILKTAKEAGLGVWLLDDKIFPTGRANCAIENKHPELRKKLLHCNSVDVLGPQNDVSVICESYILENDRLLAAIAYRRTGEGLDCSGKPIELTDTFEDGLIHFDIPEGTWRIFFLIESQRPYSDLPYHIDMLNPDSTELMISEVYQPQYDHFAEYFGNTFRGFFSDEPGFLNNTGTYFSNLGTEMPLPWRTDLPTLLAEKLGKSEGEVITLLPGLWANTGDTADLRVAYMDIVTRLYAENFTEKLGNWCRSHSVEYIGHTIEDMNSCSRLGHSAGHYFRCLDAQDMAGIDVVLHQIMPGQNEMPHTAMIFNNIADPAFFVYALAKLGASHSHINPKMKNRAMCEIFGAYGYAEGVPFMKKLADHMLSNGINRFVPHAFSPKYPDPDCPPHFYSNGKNPQFEQFGQLIKYMQRVIHLLEGSIHQASALLYYNAECEWSGDNAIPYFEVAKKLTQNQIDFDFISEDYICLTHIENNKICLNEEQYDTLIIPGCSYITERMKKRLKELIAKGADVVFIGFAPEGFKEYVVDFPQFDNFLSDHCPHLRFYHVKRDGKDIYMFKNDGEHSIDTTVLGLPSGDIAVYDAWQNKLYRQSNRRLVLVGGESIIWILGEDASVLPEYCHPNTLSRKEADMLWNISIQDTDDNTLKPYKTASPLFNISVKGGLTRFSGKIVYTTEVNIPADTRMIDLGVVGETAKLTLNGIDCGTLIAPPYAFSVENKIKPGNNKIEIEVINNPAYRERDSFSAFMKLSPSGIIGPIEFLK